MGGGGGGTAADQPPEYSCLEGISTRTGGASRNDRDATRLVSLSQSGRCFWTPRGIERIVSQAMLSGPKMWSNAVIPSIAAV